MKLNILLAVLIMLLSQLGRSQSAEPGLSGANFVPNNIEVGDTSLLTISFVNSGIDAIPAQSIQLTISGAYQYYLMQTSPPSGPGGNLFSWVYLGQDVWRGTNTSVISGFGGGDIHVKVGGNAVSSAYEATNINVQPIANFGAFENSSSNDNLQPELKIDPATNQPTCDAGNSSPSLTSYSVNNSCPTLIVDLDNLHPGSTPSSTSLVWSTQGQSSGGPSNVINSLVTSTGTYYAYYYDNNNDCYSPASSPVGVTIQGCNDAPIATNDNAIVNLNTPVTINVLTNDSDPNNDNFSISSVGTSVQGVSAVVSGNSIIYTPPTGVTGTDLFSYSICDDGNPSKCDNATVSIQINDVLTFQNDCPDLYVDIADIHDGAIPTGTQLIWSTDDDPSDGVSPVLGSRIYNSSTVYVYYYDAVGGCYSPSSEINIDIRSCNDAPIANNDSNSGDEEETLTGSVATNDSDPNNDNLTYTVVDDVDHGTLTLNSDGTYTYIPDIEYVGTDQFTYRVCDDGIPQLCNTAIMTFTMTVLDFVCVNIDSKVLLEGKVVSDQGELTYLPQMRTDLNDLRLLPGQSYANNFTGTAMYTPAGQPYSGRPWLHNGTEGDQYDSQSNPAFGDAGYPESVVDWVLVSLRENVDDTPQSIICQEAVMLHEDGTMEMVAPCCGVDRRKEYFIVVEHRNHLLVMSPQKVDMERIGTQADAVKYGISHDFTLANSFKSVDPNFSAEIGTGQKMLPDGRWVMFAGNAEQKYTQDDTDLTVDDEVIWGDQNSTIGLYKIGDFNLNGDINFNDRVLWEENNGIFSSVPRDKNQ